MIDGAGRLIQKNSNRAGTTGICERRSVYPASSDQPFKTIDSMIPIGRGQRELIIGDRQTEVKLQLQIPLTNQKGKDVICIM